MFCGSFFRTSVEEAVLEGEVVSVSQALASADPWPHGRCVGKRHFLMGAALSASPVLGPLATPRAAVHHLQVAAWARLDGRGDVCRLLGLDSQDVEDVDIIALAYAAWGEDCVTQLYGDYAFAVVDTARQSLFLARDPMGARPLYYADDGECIRFSTTLGIWGSHGHWRAIPDRQWVSKYFLPDFFYAKTESPYVGVLKLAPGARLSVWGDCKLLPPFFKFRSNPEIGTAHPKWLEQYRESLARAVLDRVPVSSAFAAENSGGIDSAAIIGELGAGVPDVARRLHTFSHAVGDQETMFCLDVARTAKLKFNHVLTDSLSLGEEQVTRALDVAGYPLANQNAWGASVFLDLCQPLGLTRIFSGFGGDECVSCDGDLLVRALWNARQFQTLWQAHPASFRLKLRGLWRLANWDKFRGPFDMALFEAYAKGADESLLTDEVIRGFDLKRQYCGQTLPNFHEVNDYALHMLDLPFVCGRQEECSLMARSYGVDYVWPLLDRRLIQQYLDTPTIEKFGPKAIHRYLHRRAMVGKVPERVIWWTEKGFSDSFPAVDKYVARRYRALMQELDQQIEGLHPFLTDIVDVRKAKSHLKRMESEWSDWDYFDGFERKVRALMSLNAWLYRIKAA